jgi:hypothetical protein
MRGFPKYLNTKTDYEYVKATFPPEQWRPRFQALLDERFAWLPVGPLADGQPGVEDETHRVLVNPAETGQNVPVRVQEEYREDPNATIFRLGFTVEEVTQILEEEE